MNFDKQLSRIIEIHDLKPCMNDINPFENEIIRLIEEYSQKGTICLWGEEEQILETLNFVDLEKIKFVVINNKKTDGEILNLKSISPNSYKANSADYIFVISIRYKNEIMKVIESASPDQKCIDMYKKLEKLEGLEDFQGINYFVCKEYRELYWLKSKFEESSAREDKEKYLLELIKLYLDIKDFVNGFKFMDLYTNNNYSEKDRIVIAKKEIESLIMTIRNNFENQKDRKDIVVYYIDAVRNKDIFNKNSKMPYIKSFEKNSIVFNNAFSASIDTLMTVFSMFTGKLALDDNLYPNRNIDFSESELYQKLINNNYHIYNYYTWKDFFKKDKNIKTIRVKKDNEKLDVLSRSIAPRLLWNYIVNLEKNEKTFSIIHMFYETHIPHGCGFHKNRMVMHKYWEYLLEENQIVSKEEFKEQYEESLNYIDKQIQFYDELVPKNITRIVFGDHGQSGEKIIGNTKKLQSLLSWHDDRIHVPLIIKSQYSKSKIENELFSMKDLWKIINSIIDEKLHYETSTEVPIQFDPIYNNTVLDILKSVQSEKFAKGYKMLRNDKFKYILYDDLDEELYRLPNEIDNVIDISDYSSVLNIFRNKLTNKDFPEFNEPQYKKNKKIIKRKFKQKV